MTTFNKALVAALSAGSAVYVAAAILNSVPEQLAAAAVAGLIAALAVYQTPNAPAAPTKPAA